MWSSMSVDLGIWRAALCERVNGWTGMGAREEGERGGRGNKVPHLGEHVGLGFTKTWIRADFKIKSRPYVKDVYVEAIKIWTLE